MNRLLAGVVVLVLVLICGSCAVGKKPVRKKVIVDSTAVTKLPDTISKQRAVNEAKQALISQLTPLWQQHINFTTFNGKAKMHYDGPDQKQEFTANIRIKKDEVIWASVTALGLVNVARIYITPDSFKLINYLENNVLLMSFADAGKVLPVPVDFSILQNMIIGNVLKQSGKVTDANEFGGTWSLSVEDGEYLQQLTYNKSDSTLRSGQLMTKAEGGPQGMIQYGNYETVSNRRFANSRAINIVNKGLTYYMDMNFNKVEFDQPVDFPFSIPKKFKINGVDENVTPAEQRKVQRKAAKGK